MLRFALCDDDAVVLAAQQAMVEEYLALRRRCFWSRARFACGSW